MISTRAEATDEDSWPYSSATFRQLSWLPPVTRMHRSFRAGDCVSPWTRSANGVWLWTNMLVSRETPSTFISSATRAVSCVPPPLVSRMKGIRCLWRNWSVLGARATGLELLRRTPSILQGKSEERQSAVFIRYALKCKGKVWESYFGNKRTGMTWTSCRTPVCCCDGGSQARRGTPHLGWECCDGCCHWDNSSM